MSTSPSESDPNRRSAPDIRSRLPRTTRTERTYEAVHYGRLNPYGSRHVRVYERFTRTRPKQPDTRRRPTRHEWAWIFTAATATTLTAAILTATRSSEVTDRDIHHHIAELTRPHTLREPYQTTDDAGTTWTSHHTVQVPSLLDQLANPQRSNNNTSAEGPITFGPSTPAFIEALDTRTRIDLAAAKWLRRFGEYDPATTEACVTAVGILYRNLPDDTRNELAADVRSWWTSARIMAGWDQPQWRPDNTCPIAECGSRGTLRIRRDATGALCIDCRTVWTEDQVGLLAEHIRLENREDDVA